MGRGRGGVAQTVMARSMTACFGMNKLRCVTVNVETHVTSVKTDDGVWLCWSIVHQNVCLLDGGDDGRSFLGADFVETYKNNGIDGM